MITFENQFASLKLDLMATQTDLEMEYDAMCESLDNDSCAARARYLDDVLHIFETAMKYFEQAEKRFVALEKTGGIKY